ncbi:cytochrome c oxidase assembly protein CtaG [Agaricicola taiwanensis]|uniref:Cytochrome c oxidase assembly protein CtaG n=1 Tax=Agaricicola taiwanensis TaxID=591372 RepID=A0A8J2YDN5_9RHOB|nr:cytochrome c oxidase assembly protein [Agaricicola taiwanensis]GGE34652.1 cytochrome c oxidase assembly protein CtaG [Agaricicola taiwanensis]
MNDAPQTSSRTSSDLARRHKRVAMICVLFGSTMLGAAFAAVPLYDLFCRVTGFGGTTTVASSAPAAALERTVKVRFDGNVAPGLSWEFVPEEREVTVKLGETRMVVYKATNLSSQDTWGTASYNVSPGITGSYFAKLQCFCFTKQHLKPGETLNMPVVFFVDPAIVEDGDASRVKTITLSYTFFPTEPDAKPTAQVGTTKTQQPM